MTNGILIFLALLCVQGASAASLPATQRQEVARTLTRVVGREIAGGAVQVSRIDAAKKQVRIYASIGLSYYPFRPENTQAMYDSVRKAMPSAYRRANVLIYTDNR